MNSLNSFIYYTVFSVIFMLFIILANMEKLSIISSISGNIMLLIYTFFITNDVYFTLFFQTFVIIIGSLEF